MANVALKDWKRPNTKESMGVMIYEDRLLVDVQKPNSILVRALNIVTGEYRDYLLRVSESGKLSLV